MTLPLAVALPIADRRRSFAFFGAGLGLETPGEPADDGVPEPLAIRPGPFEVMLVPEDGFAFVSGRPVAGAEAVRGVLCLAADSPADVDTLVARARTAGAGIVSEPGAQPWAYSAIFADPDGHLWQVTAAASATRPE